jgi:phage terminase large subunit-like protein
MIRTLAEFRARWRDHQSEYYNDLPLFIEDQYVLDTGESVTLDPHQREKFRVFFERDANGKFRYSTMIDSDTKKSAKTTETSMVCLWIPFVEPGEPECYAVANDLEQSRSRSFRMIEHAIRKNPLLAGMCKIRKSPRPSIQFPSGTLEAIPCDYAGEAGSNPVLITFTELWAYTSEAARRLWAEMTPSPVPPNSIRFIDTYAGFTGESETLEQLYAATVINGKLVHETLPIFEDATGTIVAYWGYRERDAKNALRPSLPLPESPRRIWQTPAYYEAQRASNRPEDYDRLHRNLWQRSRSAFLTANAWDSLRHYDLRTFSRPFFGGTFTFAPKSNAMPVYVGIDAAHKRDATAIVVVGYHRLVGLVLLAHMIWTPTADEPVEPEATALVFAQRVARIMNARCIRYDPAHFETAGRTLRKTVPHTVRVEEFTQSGENLLSMGQSLYDAIRLNELSVYAAPDLRLHVLNANAQSVARGGFRIVRGENNKAKIDGAIALSEALSAAKKYGPRDCKRPRGISFI